MAYVKPIIDKLLALQTKFYSEAKEHIEQGEGKITNLRIVGIDGESLLLTVQGQQIKYAKKSDTPTEIFKCTTDTFLDIVSGDMTLREALTRGHFTIENAATRRIDIVECEKWAKAFTKLHSIVTHHMQGT